MTTQLELYNLALVHIRSSPITSLVAAVEARRVLDTVYQPTIRYMLEQGFWKFALRSVKITADTSITPTFGQAKAFNMPSDWVRTYSVSGSETFNPPLDDWLEESNLFFANIDPIFVRYVSNANPGYGADLTRWTERFTRAVTFELAWRICPKATGSSDTMKNDLEKDKIKALLEARAFEAMREPNRRPPQGRWNAARFTRNSGNWSGGYRIG